MCGICGIVNVTTDTPIDKRLLRQMCSVIVYRGPDDEGFFLKDNSVGLAVRRLSVIDLTTGHQPISNEDGSVWVVLNGEIYNFKELRDTLEQKGHKFTTKSDTESIVHLYEEYGDDCVQHLNGMFAFALWDDRRKRLLVARDRLGIKQVYYAQHDGQLIFGSEIKCILQHKGFERRIDPQSVRDFFTFLYVPAPRTIYQGISELPPGHTLTVEHGMVSIRQYWDVNFNTDESLSLKQCEDRFLELLERAVKAQMVSDVPLGAFLSGGIDSSAVVGLMARNSNRPVETFSVTFSTDDRLKDERYEQRLVAKRYATNHHEFRVSPDLVSVLPKIIACFDQPFADSSFVPNYYICEVARKHVTVALSGLGGDELAAGYERYAGIALLKHYRRIPRPFRALARRFLNSIREPRSDSRTLSRLKRFSDAAEVDIDSAYMMLITALAPSRHARFFTQAFANETSNHDPWQSYIQKMTVPANGDVLSRMLYLDTKTYLAGDLLTLTDRMSMIHSLEVRVPYLDHELVEFMAKVPSRFKLRGVTKKYLVRNAVKGLVPREIIRKKKKGFSIPLQTWFRSDLRQYLCDTLSPDRLSRLEIIDPANAQNLINNHVKGAEDNESILIALLTYTIWADLYLR